MSKKHPAELWTLVRLTLAGALICFPRGILILPGPDWLRIPVCAGLALMLANLLARLGPAPAWLRPPLLLPIALPPLFALILKPGPFALVFALLPFALLLNRMDRAGPAQRPVLRALGVFLILTVGATGLWTLSRQLPVPDLPRLPHNTFFWLGADAILILGIASAVATRSFSCCIDTAGLGRRAAASESGIRSVSVPRLIRSESQGEPTRTPSRV